ncbi:hypothetical protein J2S43_006905 [Catenuloplanes nepalensis]|uniref:Exo-alpha-sialidase n=1 Tax=Catenuloplanes nepalensis TaxID=587533 RepID=A0ABT9N4F0_9ACTN|nr:hypothetical protein [Catenuloplanes nepalensis]MDP9798393.1 hypothetical protein [Catenuloplanes nepalensis]
MPKSRGLFASLLAGALLLTALALVSRSPSATEDQHRSGVRRATVDLPAGTPPPYFEFVSRKVGYAVFSGCPDGQCPTPVFATEDGGHTWRRIAHPAGGMVNLYAVPDVLVLHWMERDVWLLSTDNGRSFVEVDDTDGRYRAQHGHFIRADTSWPVVWRGGLMRPVPRRPPVSVIMSVATGANGRIWAAGLGDRVPSAAYSTDGGTVWIQTPVPPQGDQIRGPSLSVSADGRDVWLLAGTDDVTRLWTFTAGRWLPVAARGLPPGYGVFAIAAGGGALIVGGQWGGQGVIWRGRYWPRPDWDWLDDGSELLADGTIYARSGQRARLGVGFGAERWWTEIVLEPAA